MLCVYHYTVRELYISVMSIKCIGLSIISGKLEMWVQSPSVHPQNFPSLDSVVVICNSSLHRGEEKALPQFRQDIGPVTSCMHACSGSGRHGISLRIDIWVTMCNMRLDLLIQKNNWAKKFFIWEEMNISQVTGRNCIVLYNRACSVQGRLCHYTHICVTGMMSTMELPPHGRQMSHYTSLHVTGTHMEGNS